MSGGSPGSVESKRPRVGVERDPGAQQRRRVRVRGPRQHVRDRPGLDDAARVTDRDPVGDLRGDAEVVGDDDERAPKLVAQAADQLQDLRLDRDVERRRRLVGDDERRLARDRHRDHHALALAAGELVGEALAVASVAPGRQPHRAELDGLLLRARHLGSCWPIVIVGFERRRRVLEDRAEVAAAEVPALLGRLAEHVDAEDAPLARDRGRIAPLGQEAEERHRRRGLAGARLADQGEDLAAVDLDVEATDRLDLLAADLVDDVQVGQDPNVLESRERICAHGTRFRQGAQPPLTYSFFRSARSTVHRPCRSTPILLIPSRATMTASVLAIGTNTFSSR